MSSAQFAQNRKKLKQSMTKEEWKDYKKQEREERREQNRITQERMASGDERYLMPRDKGEVRAFVRDWVDSRRFINEWAMPAALVMLLIMFLGTVHRPSPTFPQWPRWSSLSSCLLRAFTWVVLLTRQCEGHSLAPPKPVFPWASTRTPALLSLISGVRRVLA